MTADHALAQRIRRRLDDLRGPTPAGAALVLRLVESYLRRAPAYLAELDEARERGDTEAVVRLAHGLRGVAGNLGAAPLADLCERLEAAAPDEYGEIMGRLGAEADRIAGIFADVFPEITIFVGERSMIGAARPGPGGTRASTR